LPSIATFQKTKGQNGKKNLFAFNKGDLYNLEVGLYVKQKWQPAFVLKKSLLTVKPSAKH
jgi:hypothetical protein